MTHQLLDAVTFMVDGSRKKISGEVRGRSYHHNQWHYDVQDAAGKLHLNVPHSNINPRGSYGQNHITAHPPELSLLRHSATERHA
jgi:hypothetical protein